MDNLANYGVKSDEIRPGRAKPRGKQRKPFAIECRINSNNGIVRTLGIYEWHTHSRYLTRARRDQAFAALVKKEQNNGLETRFGWEIEYRKHND